METFNLQKLYEPVFSSCCRYWKLQKSTTNMYNKDFTYPGHRLVRVVKGRKGQGNRTCTGHGKERRHGCRHEFPQRALHGRVAVAVDHVLQHQVAGKYPEPHEFGAFVQFGQHVLVGRGVAHPVVRTDIRQFGQFRVRLRGRFLHISQIEKKRES